MVNNEIYKILPTFLTLALTVSDIYYFYILPSKSRSRSCSTIFTMTQFDGKCQNLQKIPVHFCANSYRFRGIEIKNKYLQKVGQGHGEQFLQLVHSMTNVKIYKRKFLLFFIFAKL